MNVKKDFIIAGILFSAGLLAADPNLIWQLGKTDQSDLDFLIPYRAWEYGNAPEIQRAKEMDHKTATFHYTVKENGITPTPRIVRALSSVSERVWMLKDEMVCNLNLKWNEKEGGRRLLTVRCARTDNHNGGEQGIEVRLPGGKKKLFNLPAKTTVAKKNPFSFEVVFDAVKGENELTIANVSRVMHYRFTFDSITLSRTDRKPEFAPIPELSLEGFSGIYHPGDKIKLKIRLVNGNTGKVECMVRNWKGKTVSEQVAGVKDGYAEILLPSAEKGHYSVECLIGKEKKMLAYSVVEPVKAEYIPESRFGCHALKGDSYRPRYWEERYQMKIRRAFLGGAKWARLHSVKWALREPKKGVYDWRFIDEQLKLEEEYKMIPLITIGTTPEWASVSKDRTLTSCGDYTYLFYPPENYSDLADFITVFVRKYKDRVSHFEIGNEPGYVSAFWTSGSAPAFGKYLKTAYDAVKKEFPSAVVYPGAPVQTDFLEEAVKPYGDNIPFDVLSIHYPQNFKRDSMKTANWMNLLKKLGKKPDVISSEEMHWCLSKNDPVKLASDMVKIHVRDASKGIHRTFAFDAFDDNGFGRYSFFDHQDLPKPVFSAYRAMTHRLEHAKYIGDLSGAEYEMYLFERNGKPVIVFWKDDPETLSFQLGADKIKLIDLMDCEQDLTGENGEFRLKTDPLPQYIEGGNLPILKELASAMKNLPKNLVMTAGKKRIIDLNLSEGIQCAGMDVPKDWNAVFTNRKLEIESPKHLSIGIYDGAFRLTVGGVSFRVPVLLEIAGKDAGNLIQNGDFERGAAHYFYPKDKNKFEVLPGIGTDGSKGVRTKGSVHFGMAGRIKVRKGEKYLIAYDVRGEGICGLSMSVTDANGKRIYPKKQGVNLLEVQANPEWKRVSEVISIDWKDAAKLQISVIANYRDKTGKILEIDNLTAARLTDFVTPSKVLNRGFFHAPKDPVVIDGDPKEWSHASEIVLDTSAKVVYTTEKEKWKGPSDLSVKCKAMMDGKNLYLLFDVKDDKAVLPDGDYGNSWKMDSIQFALDPVNENRGYSEFIIGLEKSGKPYVFKLVNYWTPEVPTGITVRGLVKDAEIAVKRTEDGMIYELRVPMNELYPMKGTETSFGFNFVLNDNDGHGRKYMEWAGGIGYRKDPSKYGILTEKK